jgi:beta-glucosidase
MTKLAFPDRFWFGTATSATQIEGHCRNTDWAAFSREAGRVKNGDTPDVACDAWHLWRDDVKLQAELGMQAYRFSIEWARVEPRPGEFDRDALDRYREMLGALRDARIAPMITLHHFSLPSWMTARGGLLSRDLPERLARFAIECVHALGDLCRLWITINEPNVLAAHAHLLGAWPPGRKNPKEAVVAHHRLLEAHVAMYRAMHDAHHDLEIGLAHHLRVIEAPPNATRADRAAASALRRVFNDAFAGAVCEGRMYGPFDAIARSRSGFRVADAKGTQDFFGINYYSRDVVRFSRAHAAEGFALRGISDGAETSDLGWEIFPEGLGSVLREWAARSGKPMYVTENGIADENDAKRPRFIVQHLAEIARAIADGVDVRGYLHWSLLDNFEWAEGYAPRFGLVEVDYATQARRVRPSGRLYAELAHRRAFEA